MTPNIFHFQENKKLSDATVVVEGGAAGGERRGGSERSLRSGLWSGVCREPKQRKERRRRHRRQRSGRVGYLEIIRVEEE